MPLPTAVQRASTLALAAYVTAGGAVAAASSEIQKYSAPEMFAVLAGFVVVLGGAVTLAFVRWLNKLERNVPRDPARTGEQLEYAIRRIEGLARKVDKLDGKVDGIDVRVARVEGRESGRLQLAHEQREDIER